MDSEYSITYPLKLPKIILKLCDFCHLSCTFFYKSSIHSVPKGAKPYIRVLQEEIFQDEEFIINVLVKTFINFMGVQDREFSERGSTATRWAQVAWSHLTRTMS